MIDTFEFNTALLFLFLLLIIWFKIFNKDLSNGKVRINFAFFIGMCWIMYGLLPMMEVDLNGKVNELDMSFLYDCIIALLMMIFGVLTTDIIRNSKRTKRNLNCSNIYESSYQVIEKKRIKNERFVVIMMSIISLWVLHLYIKFVYVSWFYFFTQKYGTYNSEGYNSFTAILPLFCSAYILTFNNKNIILSKFSRFIVQAISLFMISIFFLGGNRNLATMMVIAFVWCYYAGGLIKLKHLIFGIILIIIVAAIVAVGREYGMINFLLLKTNIPRDDVIRYIFAINEGEFGTMRRVYEYATQINYSPTYKYGYSYTLGTIINMIPSIIFTNRPLTLSVEFTQFFWGGLTQGTIGLGFSPIMEAKFNFEQLWGITFFFGGIMNRIIDIKFRNKVLLNQNKKNSIWFFIIGSLSAVSLNFFRIDFAITIKFFLLIVFFAICMQKILFPSKE